MTHTYTLSYRPTAHDLRRDKRLLRPHVRVVVDGMVWRTANWSMSGILLADYDGRRRPFTPVTGRLLADLEGGPGCDFAGEVTRFDRLGRTLAIAFDPADATPGAFLDGLLLRTIS